MVMVGCVQIGQDMQSLSAVHAHALMQYSEPSTKLRSSPRQFMAVMMHPRMAVSWPGPYSKVQTREAIAHLLLGQKEKGLAAT